MKDELIMVTEYRYWQKVIESYYGKWNLKPGNYSELKERWRNFGRRKARQPLNLPSAGSAFKWSPGNYAGALIEKPVLRL